MNAPTLIERLDALLHDLIVGDHLEPMEIDDMRKAMATIATQAQRVAELEKRNAVLEYRKDTAINFLPQDRRDQYYASLKRTQQP